MWTTYLFDTQTAMRSHKNSVFEWKERSLLKAIVSINKLHITPFWRFALNAVSMLMRCFPVIQSSSSPLIVELLAGKP